ncbi:MAG: response regulator [Planctomycetota bacterium]
MVEQKDFSGNETILVVEDNEMVRGAVCSILMKFGYKVIWVGDPGHCQRLMDQQEGSIHLLLTDVIMPGMNGRELYHRLSSTTANLKVIYMSGYSDNLLAEHGILDGDTPLIHKPFSLQTLLQKVRDVLDQKQPPRRVTGADA